MTTEIETDYLVIGAGATALAFVDELMRQDRGARVETLFQDDEARNLRCHPVPHPTTPADLPDAARFSMMNLDRLGFSLTTWMLTSRLNAGAHAGIWKNLVFAARASLRVRPALENLARLSAEASRQRDR